MGRFKGNRWQAVLVCAAVLLSVAFTALAQAPPATPPPAPSAPPVPVTPEELPTPLEVVDPPLALFPLPEVAEPQLVDVPGDDGTALGVLWRWVGVPSETGMLKVQLQAEEAWLDEYRITPAQEQRIKDAAALMKEATEALQPELDAARQAESDASAAEAEATINKNPDVLAKRKALWAAKAKLDEVSKKQDKIHDAFQKQTGKLVEKAERFKYLSAAIEAAKATGGWLDTDVAGPAEALLQTKGDLQNRFGMHPRDADKLYQEATAIVASAPPGPEPGSTDEYGQSVAPALQIPLSKGRTYHARMVLSEGGREAITDLGSQRARANLFIGTATNNFVLAWAFTIILLLAINAARKNPNLFIRRIAGLEAVDEAIGRATEMGKPVLYLNGRSGLDDLATLAAVNILGRVARRVAAYDSALLVPCMDPVVMSVAQEVVREGFIDAGRPDAYREDNVYFVTRDQFAYTAAVCALMIRERPAANFLMGSFAAEALLLAETGASTGAIQIAGTDQQSQLPFFITACDYTLIGEELYAASAYLSREPLLLGSLKGQDIGKAVMMLLILVQTVLFAINHEWSWLRDASQPLF